MAREAQDRYQNAYEFMEVFTGFRKKQTAPYDDYIKLSKEAKELEKDRNQLQEDYKTLERKSSKMRSYLNKIISRNWFVAVVIVIAFASNCMPYFGISENANISVRIASLSISVLASAIIVGIAIYDSFVANSNNEQE